MTNMRRLTVSLPDDLDKRILELRKDERFIRCSYSEIVRRMLDHGLALLTESPVDNEKETSLEQ